MCALREVSTAAGRQLLHCNVFQPLFRGGTPKIICHIPRNLSYENVYRPEKFDSGERNLITAKLLSGKFNCKELIYFYIVYI
jgi:hypothetical protein